MEFKIKKIGIFYNPNKPNLEEIFNSIKTWAISHNIELYFFDNFKIQKQIIKDINIAISLGGDGTILRLGRLLASTNIPIIAVNLGRVGFLADVNKNDLITTLDEIIKSKIFNIKYRDIFDVKLIRNNKQIKTYNCINDIAVKNGETSRLIDIDLFINDKLIDRYIGDGVIISTPTGSTAYSLAAGGPIVSPNLSLFIITAICPQSMNTRPLVIESSEVISIKIIEKTNTVLSIDGQISEQLLLDDKIIIAKSKNRMKLWSSKDYNYFDVLKQKLGWGNR